MRGEERLSRVVIRPLATVFPQMIPPLKKCSASECTVYVKALQVKNTVLLAKLRVGLMR